MEYELFVVKTSFVGGISVALGGLCEKGYRQLCQESAHTVEKLSLTPTHDGLFLDAQLAHTARLIAIPQWRYAAICVNAPWPIQPCGGVAGFVWADTESAEGEFVQFENQLFGCAFPGACACIMNCVESEARFLFELLRGTINSKPLSMEVIWQLSKRFDRAAGKILFCTDGSGGSIGCVLSKDGNGIEVCWI